MGTLMSNPGNFDNGREFESENFVEKDQGGILNMRLLSLVQVLTTRSALLNSSLSSGKALLKLQVLIIFVVFSRSELGSLVKMSNVKRMSFDKIFEDNKL